jgi:hypothetical protein
MDYRRKIAPIFTAILKDVEKGIKIQAYPRAMRGRDLNGLSKDSVYQTY